MQTLAWLYLNSFLVLTHRVGTRPKGGSSLMGFRGPCLWITVMVEQGSTSVKQRKFLTNKIFFFQITFFRV